MELLIAEIQTEAGTQLREMNLGVILEYAEAIRGGAVFPPVTVFSDGSVYWLADGFHRVNAHREAGRSKIEAEIESGSFEDAKWAACGANKGHGLRRSNKDKERAVREALRLPQASGMGDNELAAHCGVHYNTVGKYRAEMEVTCEIASSKHRTGRDGKSRPVKTRTPRGMRATHKQAPATPPPAPGLRVEPRPKLTVEESRPLPALTADATKLLRDFRYEDGGLTGAMTDAGVRLWGDDLEKVAEALNARLAHFLVAYEITVRTDEEIESAA
jgi:hypothetical protein